MQNIFWGIVIIVLGLVLGNSIFLGDFNLVSIIFDGLGLFWIGKGGYGLLQGQKSA
jgi:hypothetical protein